MAPVIIPPQIRFKDGTPFSDDYEDYYFSRHGGIEESTHVFMRGNNLPEAWKEAPVFTIGETGFGTGLNFLVCLNAWKSQPSRGFLNYISVEKSPLTLDQLREFLTPLEKFLPTKSLIQHYPLQVPGYHHLLLAEERCALTLLWGDAVECFTPLEARVNAWFLDGFSPLKNSDLWSPDLFKQIARLSAPRATFSTFTVARIVREGLQNAGFTITKTRGFAYKNDMLTGIRQT